MFLVATVAIGVVLPACGAPADNSMRAGYRYYSDATVRLQSPRVDSTVAIGEAVRVSPYWTADVISAATPTANAPDAITRATEYSEVRHESGVGITWSSRAESALDGAYVLSVEPDYRSHTVGLGGSQEFFDRITTLSGTARLTHDEVGRSDIPVFSESLNTYAADVTLSQIVTATAVLHLAYSLERRAGFQSSPYRYVYVFETPDARPTYALSEELPERRVRNAVELGFAWSLHRNTFLQGGYRFYADDWDLSSHTARAELWQVLAQDRLRLRVRLRGYTQTRSEFYSDRYTDARSYRTGDYRFSAMATLTGGLRLDLRVAELPVGEDLAVTIAYDRTYFDLPDYAFRSSMTSDLLSVAIAMEIP